MSFRHRRKVLLIAITVGLIIMLVLIGCVSCFNLGFKPVIDILAKIYMGCCFASAGYAGYLTKKIHEEESSTK